MQPGQTRRSAPTIVARPGQTHRSAPTIVARPGQTHRSAPTIVARPGQTHRFAPTIGSQTTSTGRTRCRLRQEANCGQTRERIGFDYPQGRPYNSGRFETLESIFYKNKKGSQDLEGLMDYEICPGGERRWRGHSHPEPAGKAQCDEPPAKPGIAGCGQGHDEDDEVGCIVITGAGERAFPPAATSTSSGKGTGKPTRATAKSRTGTGRGGLTILAHP